MRQLDERADVGLVGDVELARVDLAAEALGLVGEGGEAGLVDVAGGDLAAGLGEPQSRSGGPAPAPRP